MYGNNVQLIIDSLRYIQKILGKNDRIAIVVFYRYAQINLKWTINTPQNKQKIIKAILRMKIHGSTNIANGVNLGLRMIKQRKYKNPFTCMFVFSDGQDDTFGADQRVAQIINDFHIDSSFVINTFGYEILLNFKEEFLLFVEHIEQIPKYLILAMREMLTVLAKDIKISITENSNYKISKFYGDDYLQKSKQPGTFSNNLSFLLDNEQIEYALLLEIQSDEQINIEKDIVLQAQIEGTLIDSDIKFNKQAELSLNFTLMEIQSELKELVEMTYLIQKSGDLIRQVKKYPPFSNLDQAQLIMDKMIDEVKTSNFKETKQLNLLLQDLLLIKHNCQPEYFKKSVQGIKINKQTSWNFRYLHIIHKIQINWFCWMMRNNKQIILRKGPLIKLILVRIIQMDRKNIITIVEENFYNFFQVILIEFIRISRMKYFFLLLLQQYNQQKIQMKLCIICISETNFVSKCGCEICLDCIISWFEEKNKMVPINYIACQCNEIYTRDEILQYCIEQPYQDKIQSILLKEYLKSNDVRSCPNGKCNYYGFIKEQELCDDELKCENCNTEWKDYSIATYQYRLEYQIKNLFSSIREFLFYFLRTNECPNCGIQIQRSGGCKHMTCKTCPSQFCWHCKQPWYGHKESRCFSSFASFVALLFVQPICLLYDLGMFTYIIFLLYPFKLIATFICVHIIIIGSIADFIVMIVNLTKIYQKRNLLSNILQVGGLSVGLLVIYFFENFADYYLELAFWDYVFCALFDLGIGLMILLYLIRSHMHLAIYPVIIFVIPLYIGLDSLGVLIWIFSMFPYVKRKINYTFCKMVAYFLIFILYIFSIMDLLQQPFFITMIAIDVLMFGVKFFRGLVR